MEKIGLNDGCFLYYPQYHRLVNSEFEGLFQKFGSWKSQLIEMHQFNQDDIQRKLKNLAQLIFQVTQDCNLRCKYCSFSGKYYHKRIHTEKNMSLEIAKAGIDKVYDLIKGRQNKKFSVGFYGGEPMLDFSVIKKIVALAEKRFRDFELSYFLTTNGTVINSNHLKFFIEKKFSILVSLDGPDTVHDRHRIFKNGAGSHNVIMDNLEKIKSFSADYYYSSINLIATFPYNIKIDDYYDFFTNNRIVNKLAISVGLVDSRDTCFYEGVENEDNFRNKSVRYLFQRLKYKCKNKLPLNPLEKNLIKPYKKIDEALNEKCFHNISGTCLFDRRVFLDCDGMFHVCEKINSSRPIGNVQDGFNIKLMQNMLYEFCELVGTNCTMCNARSFCRICFANVERNGKFVLDSDWCQEKRDFSIEMLSEYIELKREGVI